MTHIGPTGEMPYDRELKPWPHPSWIALTVWVNMVFTTGFFLILVQDLMTHAVGFTILMRLLNGGKL